MSRARLASSAARAAAALLAIAACAAPVHAADEGGTQSVFATGAGGRAGGMGGAYAAVADDASATVWNPAGLGLASRRAFEASRSGDELGFTDTYAAGVLPSWRWGALAFSVRQFGADGVEPRDDRNQLAGDDLSDSESEIAIGYGKALGPAWSAGGALKLQRQSLAGYSGSGLGADLGLTVRPALALGRTDAWADRLSLGLAVRNALRPSVRLDRESVPDPTTLRMGVAWRERFGVAAIDLEKTENLGPAFHAGLEVSPRDVLALRVGFDRNCLTAGLGVRWQDLGVDYVFADRSLAPSHRVGLLWRFGPSMDESRIAAQRREDERLEARLTEAFRREQDERIAGLLKRAEDARAAGSLDEAFELLAVVRTIEPDPTGAAALEARCVRDQAAGLEARGDFAAAAAAWTRLVERAPGDSAAAASAIRCRAESDRRAARSEQVRIQFANAMDAFAAGDFESARAGFAHVVAAAPGDAEAAAMLQRTGHAIELRGDDLLRQAGRAIEDGRLDAATALLARAKALEPEPAGVAPLEAALDRARGTAAASVRASQGAAAAPAPLSPQRRRELDDLYRRGLAAMQQGRSAEAVRYWEIVWAADPGHEHVADYLKREYLATGLESFAAGRLDEAVNSWEKVLRVDPNDEKAKGYLLRAEEQRQRTRQILGAVR